MRKEENQAFLVDIDKNGKVRPWSEKKRASGLLAAAYDSIDERKALRLRCCASHLGFAVLEGGEKRLREANFCRVRLCPMCNWRRSLKIYGQVEQIVERLSDYSFLFITLTLKNCKGEDLSKTIDHLFDSWDRFSRRARIARAWKGGVRALEVTHNVDYNSKDFDTYHPHLHALVAVRKSYFNGRDYISQRDYTDMWASAARVDYVPLVHVEKCKTATAASVAEVTKYAVKDRDYILPDDWDLSISSVAVLNDALHRRRLVGWFGVFLDAREDLALDDAEDGDLIGGEGEEEAVSMVYYAWLAGYSQYVLRE